MNDYKLFGERVSHADDNKSRIAGGDASLRHSLSGRMNSLRLEIKRNLLSLSNEFARIPQDFYKRFARLAKMETLTCRISA